jgi:hypothetical protein
LVNSCEQMQICEKVFDSIDDRFKVIHHRVDEIEGETKEINNISKTISNTLTKLEILVELQRNDSVKRDNSIDEMNKIQIEITNTLKTLAINQNKTDENVDKLSKKFDDIAKDNNINLPKLIKNIGWIIVTGLIGIGIGFIGANLTKIFGG